ncbi:MAG: hypothetical protein ACK4VY_12890 [Brevundimonas sp.]
MSTCAAPSWSLMRSLAFLAAVFAVVFGSLLPSAVAASAATGEPVMLCSGDRILVVFDAGGASEPRSPTPMDSLTCADCVLSALTTLPALPIVLPSTSTRLAPARPERPRAGPWRCGLLRAGLPPPSTAPPTA